jgi:hypothetical protein
MLYHEKQVAALCGVHCINTLLQGPYFNELDLAQVIVVAVMGDDGPSCCERWQHACRAAKGLLEAISCRQLLICDEVHCTFC